MLRPMTIPVVKIPVSGKYYTLGAFSSTDPGRISVVDVQVSWSGINANGGCFKVCQRHNSRMNWSDVSTLSQNLSTTDGSENLVIQDFSSDLVAVFIDRGPATSGEITIVVRPVKFAI